MVSFDLWLAFKWSIVPLLIIFFIGLSGIMPDNPFGPARAFAAAVSGVCILIWMLVMIVYAFTV